ncbi:unnamed protein product [Malus baccata var. baccata]
MLDSFPREITHDILFRLPIKSLIQCTSVCKPWRSVIVNQSFIQSHLRRTIRFNKQNDIHLLLHHSVSGRSITSVRTHRHTTVAFNEYSEIEFPIALKEEIRNEYLHIVGICNGLVCLADDIVRSGKSFILWNPFISKSVTLPSPGITFPIYNSRFDAAIGFGYDAMTADYKVVRVVTPNNELMGPTMAEVYSLATGSWKSLGSVAPQCETYGVKNRSFLMEFFIGLYTLGLLLSVSGDRKSIALFVMNTDSKDFYLEIWVMKEYGSRSTGSRKTFSSGPELVSLDLVSKQMRSLEICGPYCSVDSYEESLLLLDKADAVSL